MPHLFSGNTYIGELPFDAPTIAKYLHEGYTVKSDHDVDDDTYNAHDLQIDRELKKLQQGQQLKRERGNPDPSQLITKGSWGEKGLKFTPVRRVTIPEFTPVRTVIDPAPFQNQRPLVETSISQAAKGQRPLVEANLSSAIKGLRRSA